MDKTQQLRAELHAAECELRDTDTARRKAVNLATEAVYAEYAPRISACRAGIEAAQAALDQHLEQTTSHPWDGKRVYRDVRRRSLFKGGERTDRERGMVEVVRSGSQFPTNMKYGRPRVGDVIIRALKKDGNPSLKVAAHQHVSDVTSGWTLEDSDAH